MKMEEGTRSPNWENSKWEHWKTTQFLGVSGNAQKRANVLHNVEIESKVAVLRNKNVTAFYS
jgi:hypothetical protein